MKKQLNKTPDQFEENAKYISNINILSIISLSKRYAKKPKQFGLGI